MSATGRGDRAEAQDGHARAIGGLACSDLTAGTKHAAYTGDVVLLATDEDCASVSIRALLESADGRRLRMTRTMVVKLLYLADLRSVASDRRARSGILWRWWHYGPYCQSLRRVEDRLVADGSIKRSTSHLSADVEEAVLSSDGASSEISTRAGAFLTHLEAVLDDHGRMTAGALTDLAYQTAPMVEAQRSGERGVVLDMQVGRTDAADVDAVMSALADRPDLVAMPLVDASSLGAPDAAEIVGMFRGNRARANRRLLAD